ncbi:dienelactone hydrolase family protein [Minwuia thermotolerans]|uniref:Carboxymethylenebutenolidase n=1 Tax=Minwuia thermotolerans TaxID=2056226 RepID=A0A2M9FVQ9_9PROT|nr:dienelactone hydrolase family protein [Minwuia thermotolerans]PJK27537.1 carboxymethylenebutenolidase [Minwuia thermotolerans]
MGQWIKLKASDGHEFDAWRAAPAGTPKGAVVVIQEIFGVNAHIRDVAEGYAAEGYLAIAPAIYDRIEPGLECGYTPEEIAKAREWRAACDLDKVLLDIEAAVDEASKAGKVGMVGYCWGGSLVYISCCRMGDKVAAGSGYYGGQIMPHITEEVKAPLILHFGENDKSIPLQDVRNIAESHPEVGVHLYKDTGHGFNCDHRADYHAENARVARELTLKHFAEHVDA